MRRIREVVVETDPDLHSELKIYSHSEWRKDYPWMVQGITGADFDLRLFGSAPAGAVMRRWDVLRDTLGFERAAHAEQVHGNGVARHQRRGGPGIEVLAATDGHATSQPGVLLTVAVADCVPVFLLDPQGRRIAIVHAGWRGVVAGILGAGVAHLIDMGAEVDDIRLHLGPHICDVCYEVGARSSRSPGRSRARRAHACQSRPSAREASGTTRYRAGPDDSELDVHSLRSWSVLFAPWWIRGSPSGDDGDSAFLTAYGPPTFDPCFTTTILSGSPAQACVLGAPTRA